MRCVVLESPYAGDVAVNIIYARRCIRDSLLRGEAPIASHLLYTQPGVLDDGNGIERRHGIAAGLSWLRAADATVVYCDRGITSGMERGIRMAIALGKPIDYRTIDDDYANYPGGKAPWEDEPCDHPSVIAQMVKLAEMLRQGGLGTVR